jgi:iron-sulfur cluster assembly protein
MAITLTEAAARHVNRYLARRGKGLGVRLGVKTTGCSGLAYKLEYVDDSEPEDIVFENHGVKVLIDPKSLAYIDGTELDFVREGLNEGFKFNNPNERDRCGCGESFRVLEGVNARQPAALHRETANALCAGGFFLHFLLRSFCA